MKRYSVERFELKEDIIRELDAIETPDVDEQWLKFKNRYGLREKGNANRLPNNGRYATVAWAAAVLIAFALLSLANPEKTNAIGEKMIQSFRVLVGGTTENKVTTETRDGAAPQIGDIVVQEPEKEVTLEEAQTSVYFTLGQPTYLPEGAQLAKVLFAQLHSDLYRITLQYEVESQTVTLVQRNTTGDNGDSLLYDTDDSTVYDLDINGNPGYAIRSKDGSHTVIWRSRGLTFELSGNIPEDELIKIARSVK